MQKLYKQSFLIKIIALITMIIDHVGALFFPQLLVLRVIGRFSFPLFGWLVAEGFDKTHNKKQYLLRMIGFFIISQIPYWLAFHDGQLNIFLTLSIGLSVIWVLTQKTLNGFLKTIFTFILLFTSFVLPIDYGLAGVVSIIAFYFLKNSYWKSFAAQGLIWAAYVAYAIVNLSSRYQTIDYSREMIQLVALLAVPVIYIISRYYTTTDHFMISRSKKFVVQYGFYLFYPVHLLILIMLLKIV